MSTKTGRGRRIKELLAAKSMSARDLAKMTETTETSISRYISESRVPKVNEMAKIAAALSTTIDYLETGREEEKNMAKDNRPIAAIIKDLNAAVTQLEKRGINIYDWDHPERELGGFQIIRGKLFFLAADLKEQSNP